MALPMYIHYKMKASVQGALELLYDLQEHLVEITGMDEVTFNLQLVHMANGQD